MSHVTSVWQSWVLSLLCWHLYTKKWDHYKSDKDFSRMRSLHHFTICHISGRNTVFLCHPGRWVVIGAQIFSKITAWFFITYFNYYSKFSINSTSSGFRKMVWNVNGDAQEYHFSPFATQFCRNIVQFRPFFSLIEQFMQFDPVDWPFLPNTFECIKSVWPFIKISDWPFLRNTINIVCDIPYFHIFGKIFQTILHIYLRNFV